MELVLYFMTFIVKSHERAERKYGMEINIDKSQVMRVSRSNQSLQIKVNNRELIDVDHFKYLGKRANKRWLLHKGNQDKNCHCQRSI